MERLWLRFGSRLVAQDPILRHRGDVPFQDVEIRSADRDGVDPDDRVEALLDGRLRDLFPVRLSGP
jgi:hypothetical protein